MEQGDGQPAHLCMSHTSAPLPIGTDIIDVQAGLFSAIQTAFNVELYKRLTPDPDPDPILVALERISAQLSGFAVNLAFVNSTQPGFVLGDAKTPDVPAWVVVLNALWFSSLISSLAAASIAIMAKQWLTEYKSGVSGTTRQTARLRQLRLNSLKQWRVEEIVSFLPVLLQIASGLFFAGLLILLWNLNRTVAIIGTVLVGILAVFSFSTIILPSVAAHCSYLSPPSRLLFALTRPCWRALYLFRRQLSSRIASYYYCYARELYHFDLNCADAKQFRGKHPHIYRLCKMLFPRDRAHTLVWRGMESALVSQHTQALDGEMVATAYMTSMNTNFLHRAAMCTTELSLSAMRTCFQAIMSANIAHWGTDGHREPMRLVHPCMWSGALIALMDASGNDTAWSPSTLVAALDTVYKYIGTSSQQLQSDTPATRLLCVDFTRIICHYDPSTLPPDFLNIAEHLYRFKLQSIMGGTRDMNLGNDVRQHGKVSYSSRFVDRLRANARILVVSACIGDALKGFEGIIEDASIKRALFALRCIIYCVPSKTGSDYKCDDPEYKAIQSQAARALEAFSNFLSTSPSSAGRCTFEIDDVLDALRKHGEGAGLMSVELRRAIVRYWDSADEYIRLYLRDNKEWIQTLRGESGQVRTRRLCPSTCALTSVHLEHRCRCCIYIWWNRGPAYRRRPDCSVQGLCQRRRCISANIRDPRWHPDGNGASERILHTIHLSSAHRSHRIRRGSQRICGQLPRGGRRTPPDGAGCERSLSFSRSSALCSHRGRR